jgi:hypothetical protein
MTHGVNAHETASYLMQTGRLPGRISSPSVGAVVSQFKGYDAGYEGPDRALCRADPDAGAIQ